MLVPNKKTGQENSLPKKNASSTAKSPKKNDDDDDEDSKEKKERKVNKMEKSEFAKMLHFKKFFENVGMRGKWFTWRIIDHASKELITKYPWLKNVCYIAWDAQHNELEAYSASGAHLGALIPETLEFYKAAVANRWLPKI